MAHHWEQVNAVHFCARLGKSPAETHDLLLQAYQQDAIRKVAAKDYYTRFQKKGNSFPETYGRKSIVNVKNRSNRKEFCESGNAKTGEIISDEHGSKIKIDEYGSSKCLDINLHLQWGDADSIDIDVNPSNSTIKNFLNNIESSCNEHLKPQKLRISTNQEDSQVGEVDEQNIPQTFIESEPVQEINVDSTMEVIESSDLLIHETEEITRPIPETEDITSPSPEVEETTSPSFEIEEITDLSLSSHETEEITSLSSPSHGTQEITSPSLSIYEKQENTSPILPSYETQEITSPSLSSHETAENISICIPSPEIEEIASFILPSPELEGITTSSIILSDETVVATKKRSTPRKTRSKCRCPTCRLKF